MTSLSESKPLQDIIDQAVEEYRGKAFLQGLSEDFRSARSYSESAEEALWDNVLADGIGDE